MFAWPWRMFPIGEMLEWLLSSFYVFVVTLDSAYDAKTTGDLATVSQPTHKEDLRHRMGDAASPSVRYV